MLEELKGFLKYWKLRKQKEEYCVDLGDICFAFFDVGEHLYGIKFEVSSDKEEIKLKLKEKDITF